uniref:Uncharacterized protein n=1 Tax=Monodon monoceros TaxID=40151 RepID=A0A8C6B529_MONMO
MVKLLPCFLVLINRQCSAQEERGRVAFVFPIESHDSFAALEVEPIKAWHTVYDRFYANLTLEINSVYHGETFGPNVLTWREPMAEVHGEVFTKPRVWPQ